MRALCASSRHSGAVPSFFFSVCVTEFFNRVWCVFFFHKLVCESYRSRLVSHVTPPTPTCADWRRFSFGGGGVVGGGHFIDLLFLLRSFSSPLCVGRDLFLFEEPGARARTSALSAKLIESGAGRSAEKRQERKKLGKNSVHSPAERLRRRDSQARRRKPG